MTAAAALWWALSAVPDASAQPALVVYGDGRVLVRRVVPVAVPRGTSRHRVELDQLDPGSLVALDSGVSITDVQYPRTLDEATLYRASVGRRLLFRRPQSGDTVSAMVVGEDPPRFELATGQVSLIAPGAPLFPKELAGSARPTLIVVESDRALPRLALAYMTDGVTWKAEYSVVLRAEAGEVAGRIVLNSGDVRADSAEVKVLEGQVGRVSGFNRERPSIGERAFEENRLEEIVLRGAASLASAPQAPIGVGGFRIYAVPGRHSLTPGGSMVAALFGPIHVGIEKIYAVSDPGADFGGGERPLPVELQYRLTRPRESAFGAQAIPPGLARLYARAPDGSTLLVGEAVVARGDPGATLELTAGNAVTLTARRLATKVTQVQDTTVGADGRPQVYTGGQVADAEVRLANVADTAAVVELTEQLGAQARLVSSSVPAEPLERARLRFRVRVPARGEASLKYRVRVSP
jgi:hypothetical protein